MFDVNDPILALGANLLANSGWSPTPVTFGQVLGASMRGALSDYLKAQQVQSALDTQALQRETMQQALEQEKARQSAWERAQQMLMPQENELPGVADRFRAATTLAPYDPTAERMLFQMGLPWQIKTMQFGDRGVGAYAVNPLTGQPQPLWGGIPSVNPLAQILGLTGEQMPQVQQNVQENHPLSKTVQGFESKIEPLSEALKARQEANRQRLQEEAQKRVRQRLEREYYKTLADLMGIKADEDSLKGMVLSRLGLAPRLVERRMREGKIGQKKVEEFRRKLQYLYPYLDESKRKNLLILSDVLGVTQ